MTKHEKYMQIAIEQAYASLNEDNDIGVKSALDSY